MIMVRPPRVPLAPKPGKNRNPALVKGADTFVDVRNVASGLYPAF
jgi:hypothetical protein